MRFLVDESTGTAVDQYLRGQGHDATAVAETIPQADDEEILALATTEDRIIRELDTVVLTRDLEQWGLKQGDIGAVVHCYPDGKAFEVEFVTADGKTAALLTLTSCDIRPMSGTEILHVRQLV